MRKTLLKVLTLALVATMLVCTLASCGSTYDKIEANFKDEGYTVVKSDEAEMKEVKEALKDIDVEVHFLQTEDKKSGVIILEFDSSDVLEESKDNDYIKAMLEMYKAVDKDVKFIRDNCLLIPGSMNPLEIKSMIDIFNK